MDAGGEVQQRGMQLRATAPCLSLFIGPEQCQPRNMLKPRVPEGLLPQPHQDFEVLSSGEGRAEKGSMGTFVSVSVFPAPPTDLI